MLILLTGATGFLGRHLLAALTAAGHRVRAVRRAAYPHEHPGVEWVQADYAHDQTPEAWLPHLDGVEAVINAVGILRETPGQRFDDVHERAPIALFHAAVQAHVGRVLQISALGADADATTRYHLSKKHADDALLSLPLAATVIQPSLVYGPGGASARLLLRWAALPWIPLPGHGEQRLQPVHVDDLCAAVVALLAVPQSPRRLAAVGPQALTLRDYLAMLRRGLGLGPPHFLPVPAPWVHVSVALAAHLPGSLADSDSLAMLERGNTADVGPFAAVLGHAPRAPDAYIDPDTAPSERTRAQLAYLLPLLRASIAAVWLVSGIVSLAVYPVSESLSLLQRSGITPAAAPLMLYGAAGLDLVLGLATLAPRRPRALWLVQSALIVIYTAIISFALPEFWAHPYGPIVKNLPMLAALWMIYTLED